MSLVRYELGFISQKAAFFISTAVKTSNLTYLYSLHISQWKEVIKHKKKRITKGGM
jgi:hypothetical protein